MLLRSVAVFCLLACATLAGAKEGVANTTASDRRVWRAGVETAATPYTFQNAEGQPDGYSVELLREAAASQGIEVQFLLMDWPRLLEEFKAGRLEVICNVASTPERRTYIDFSTSTMTMRSRLFRRTEGPEVHTEQDLRGLRVAVPPKSRADEYLGGGKYGLSIVPVASLAECVHALHEGRVDVVFATELVTQAVIRERGYTNIVATNLDFPDLDYRMHFGVPKNQPRLLEQLNEGLAAVHKNGRFDQLQEKWLGHLSRRPLHLRDLQPYLLAFGTVVVVALGVFIWQRALLRRISAQAQSLRENEQRLQLVFEGSQDGFWDWEVTSGHIFRSPRWASMLGYSLDEIGLSRQSFVELVHPDDRSMLDEDYQRLLQGEDHFNLEFRMRTKSGEWKWILDRGKVVARDPLTGAPSRITGTHTDITPRKLAEEQADRLEHKMQETQKLESLGLLAGGIAHDFNNLLTVILGNSALARMEAGESTANRERLDSVVQAAQRAAELCHQLLAYAGRASYTVENIVLNDLVAETARLAEMSIGKHATLQLELGAGIPLLEGDAAQLRQVVMNLVINAAESFGIKSGTIKIQTTVAPPPGGESPASTSAREDRAEFICLSVSDTGCGMPPEVVARVFDPFFSTKFTGRGLGLAAVLGIVRAHRGTVKVESAPGKGSTFRVYFPALRIFAKPSSPPSSA